MTKLRGTGMAAVNYPTGMNLGGDPSQALIHATTSGSFVVTLSATDLGQGLRTVIGQIAAETLGVEFEESVVDTADTDTGPHDMGTFASRATHRDGTLPVNVSGGLKAKGHPLGATGVSQHVMAAMQLSGTAGDMQLAGARRAAVHNMGGMAVANYVSVLEST